ncbi:hypothetical protein CANCADRAFT_30012 [Tortispora caseinolytica NRRL Y-17796]|uniref:Large ribosomal subunit protein uL15/eL18 domain-containing protein n=1 Tax=Tortispora caseinolytica NRRL Y-17796 TaxID=767744 RepID=A0A1E4TIU0_9ASCO|nr:hypothetical protein CANCADRAFT_30012 [Tortispora caseinolytica NRRL Y-17796]
MSLLNQLSDNKGAQKVRTVKGRGPGGSKGGTAGRGQKGQKARESIPNWFEGGQTPITKIFPKRGFQNVVSKRKYVPVNLGDIQARIDDGRLDSTKPITVKEMYDCGLARITGSGKKNGIKILSRGAGALKQPVEIVASSASFGAIENIEKVGGKFEARYFNGLALRYLTKPEKFERAVKLAEPTSRRDIEYYSDERRHGYIAGKERPSFEQYYNYKGKVRNTNRKSVETEFVDYASRKAFENNRTVSFAEFTQ